MPLCVFANVRTSGFPHLLLETEHETTAGGSMRVRIESFVEMIKRRTEEHLGRGTGRIGEGEDVLNPAVVGLLDRQRFDGDPAAFEPFPNPLQRNPVPHLPADVHNLVAVTGHDDDAREGCHADQERG